MTRKEAIKEMIRAYDVLDFTSHMDNRRKEAFNMAKAALEQESILDEIRAEILRKSYGGFELGEGFRDGYNTAMIRVLNILDKYKSESEK